MIDDLTAHQVRMLQTATARMEPGEQRQFRDRVLRLLASWGRCPPDTNDHVLSQAIVAITLIDDARERGVEEVLR